METPNFVTPNELAERLAERDYRPLVETYILRGTPYVFRDSPERYDILRRELGRSLEVAESSLVLVGSGKTGFSLSPDTFGQPFSEDSDLDVAVVSARLFDIVWFDLLRLRPAKRAALDEQVRNWVETHRTLRIFHGRAVPHQLRGATRLSGSWFRAFKSLARIPELSGYEVHGMLFRTWEHARLYYVYGLSLVRDWLSKAGGVP